MATITLKDGLQKMSNEILTIENWLTYLGTRDSETGTHRMFGYLDAVQHRIAEYQKILQTAKNFKELSNQLTALMEGEKAFLAHVNEEWADDKYDKLHKEYIADSKKKWEKSFDTPFPEAPD